jgi:hypothetical protein
MSGFDIDDIEHHVARDDEAKAAGRAAERAAIVAFLRSWAKATESSCGRQGARSDEVDDMADRIERAEHLR